MSGGLCTARPEWSSARRSPPGLSCRKVGLEKLARASAVFTGTALPLPALAGGLLGASGGAAGSAEVVLGRSGDLERGGGAPPELTRCATAERTRFSMLPPCPALGRGPAPGKAPPPRARGGRCSLPPALPHHWLPVGRAGPRQNFLLFWATPEPPHWLAASPRRVPASPRPRSFGGEGSALVGRGWRGHGFSRALGQSSARTSLL